MRGRASVTADSVAHQDGLGLGPGPRGEPDTDGASEWLTRVRGRPSRTECNVRPVTAEQV
eukprot:1932352-Rhodomonas_salina.1